MLSNWVTVLFRNILRHQIFTIVKILGSSLGIATAVIVALLVRDDLNYDNFFKDPNLIYRISTKLTRKGLAQNHYVLTPGDLVTWLNQDYSDTIESTRLAPEKFEIKFGSTETTQDGYSVDGNIFDILDLHFIAGDAHHALDEPNSVVLTAAKAQLIFGTPDAMGLEFQIVDSDNHQLVRVTGILSNLPHNTHLDTEIFISGKSAFSFLHAIDQNSSSSNSLSLVIQTYARFKSVRKIEDWDNILQTIVANHYSPERIGDSILVFSPDEIKAIHLDADGLSGRHGTDIFAVFGMGTIGVLILVISIINYSNLVIAQAATRFVEIGIRKMAGAARVHIVGQLFLENMIFSFISLIIGLGLVIVILPSLNVVLDRMLYLDILHDGFLDSVVLSLLAIMSVGGGAYPMWVLSRIAPSAALTRGGNKVGGRTPLRQFLVVLQFAAGIGMIVSTVVIYQQGQFATSTALRFDKDQILIVRTHSGCRDAFKHELLARRGVLTAACSYSAPLNDNLSTAEVGLPDGRQVIVARQPIDFGFFDLYHLPLITGRDFSRDHLETDQAPSENGAPMTSSVIINETAVRNFGFKTADAALGQAILVRRMSEGSSGERTGRSTIIGVVTDFPVESIRSAILPTVFYVDPASFQLLNVKLKSDDVAAGVASVDAVWHEFGPGSLIQRFFLDAQIRARYDTLLRDQNIFLVLSVLGILVACIGLFGLTGYVAQARTKEIGVRKALGATTQQVVWLLVWQFVRPVVIANLVAWPISAWILKRWLDSFTLRIDLDPLLFIASGGLATIIAIFVTTGHAIKAARSRPITALRYE